MYNAAAACETLQPVKLDLEFKKHSPNPAPNDAQILDGPVFPIVSCFYLFIFWLGIWLVLERMEDTILIKIGICTKPKSASTFQILKNR